MANEPPPKPTMQLPFEQDEKTAHYQAEVARLEAERRNKMHVPSGPTTETEIAIAAETAPASTTKKVLHKVVRTDSHVGSENLASVQSAPPPLAPNNSQDVANEIAARTPQSHPAIYDPAQPIVPLGGIVDSATTAELRGEGNIEAKADVVVPPKTVEVSARLTGMSGIRANPDAVPASVPIFPTIYPDSASGPVTVVNHITINVNSPDYHQLKAILTELLPLLKGSNVIAGETKDQLIAEIAAGQQILPAPKVDPNYVDMLLVRPLKFIAEKVASETISKLAAAALELLGKLTGWW